ncbi:hypothetical protein [Aromatoleum sp.]|uniref:hypothetical protein n=1 Tax=Aromatoleum sp. TaxID=2307007 RepID=UPI002FC8EBFF
MNGKFVKTIVVAAALAAGAGLVGAAAPEHNHGAAPAAMKLDHGRKWSTDAPLRQGMSEIRARVEKNAEAIHRGKFGAGDYAALAGAVEAQVAYIVDNCRLEPAADEVLHGVIAELAGGVEVLNGKRAGVARDEGVSGVVTALNRYGEYFDHPGWKPVH